MKELSDLEFQNAIYLCKDHCHLSPFVVLCIEGFEQFPKPCHNFPNYL